MKNRKLTNIIAIFAVIVSIYTMYILWQGLELSRQVAEEQIEQIRLSVKPLLSFNRITNPYHPTNGIRLQNDGVGPALIDSMKFFYKCELSDDWEKLSKRIITDNLIFAPHGTSIGKNTLFKGGAYLKEGESIWIIYIPYEKLTDLKKYRDYLSNFSITLYYQSILGYRDSIKYGDECS